jgi:hypothetical protein
MRTGSLIQSTWTAYFFGGCLRRAKHLGQRSGSGTLGTHVFLQAGQVIFGRTIRATPFSQHDATTPSASQPAAPLDLAMPSRTKSAASIGYSAAMFFEISAAR